MHVRCCINTQSIQTGFVGTQKTMSLEDAVEHAITECIHEGILKSFLEKNRAEVKKRVHLRI